MPLVAPAVELPAEAERTTAFLRNIDPRGRCDIHIVNVKSKSAFMEAEGAMQYVGVVKTSKSAASIASTIALFCSNQGQSASFSMQR